MQHGNATLEFRCASERTKNPIPYSEASDGRLLYVEKYTTRYWKFSASIVIICLPGISFTKFRTISAYLVVGIMIDLMNHRSIYAVFWCHKSGLTFMQAMVCRLFVNPGQCICVWLIICDGAQFFERHIYIVPTHLEISPTATTNSGTSK